MTSEHHWSSLGFLVDLFERGMPRGIPRDQISQNGRHVYHSGMPHIDHPSDNHHTHKMQHHQTEIEQYNSISISSNY